MKFDVDDKNRCRLVCVKFHSNRCRFAAAVAKCLGGSLFCGHSVEVQQCRGSPVACAAADFVFFTNLLKDGTSLSHVFKRTCRGHAEK